ncbi:MAG TPA: polysaccharide deacetylase family protein [Gemmatimonadaceae bacterium]|nr:polysaccharide deacetylase family protein [Gemmatimonadaceae bacterium]
MKRAPAGVLSAWAVTFLSTTSGCATARPAPAKEEPIAAAAPVSARSGLPNPGTGGVPRPAGPPGGLRVLDWAGFRSAVSYTLDDAQPSHLEHYDALQATGVRMTFYVSSVNAAGSVGFWRRVVADGHELGNHTAHHCHVTFGEDPFLSGCAFGTLPADATADSEIDDVSTFLTGAVGQPGVWTMASPFGDSNWDAHAARRFVANRDVYRGMVAPGDSTDPFHLPGYMPGPPEHGGIPATQAALDAVVDEARAGGKWVLFVLHSLGPTSESWYGVVDVRDLLGNVARVQAAGDVWADTVVNVAAYWRGQTLLASVEPATAAGGTVWRWELPPNFPAGKFLRVRVDGGTLTQGGGEVPWDDHGFYEIALDARELTLRP